MDFIYNPLSSLMAILDCLVDYTWNKLHSRNGQHTCERFFCWFEVGPSTPSLNLWGRKTHTFDPNLEMGRHNPLCGSWFRKTHTPLIQILRQEGMMGHTFCWNIRKEGRFALCLFALALLEHPFPHWHWSLRLQDSNTYWRSVETPILVGLRNYYVFWLTVHR